MQFHAHIYFDAATRGSAVRLRDYFIRRRLPQAIVGPMEDTLRGPHPRPMFEIDLQSESLAEVVSWLLIHRGEHPVLIHAVTGNDVVDHDRHALWMGEPQPLDVTRLDPPLPGWKSPALAALF
jgi:DOPA 4,5-dioxygenase